MHFADKPLPKFHHIRRSLVNLYILKLRPLPSQAFLGILIAIKCGQV